MTLQLWKEGTYGNIMKTGRPILMTITRTEYQPESNASGYSVINDLRIDAVINTAEKGLTEAIWQAGS